MCDRARNKRFTVRDSMQSYASGIEVQENDDHTAKVDFDKGLNRSFPDTIDAEQKDVDARIDQLGNASDVDILPEKLPVMPDPTAMNLRYVESYSNPWQPDLVDNSSLLHRHIRRTAYDITAVLRLFCLTPVLRSRPFNRRDIKNTCYPHGLTYQATPLALTLIATFLTGFGSWSCEYFSGADIGFIGNTYGLWTLQDIHGKCQLWDVLFFSYNLDGSLIAARGLSMAAMFLGLAMLTSMSQAMQYHIVSWGIGLIFLVLLIVSIATTNIFNAWITFWLFTYVFFVLITRALFIHPVHRRISSRGSQIHCDLHDTVHAFDSVDVSCPLLTILHM